MKRAAILCLALAACAHDPTIVKEYVEVEVPVPVQPIKPADVPAVPAPLGPRPSQGAAERLASWGCSLWAYVLKADPLLRHSAGMEPHDLPSEPLCE